GRLADRRKERRNRLLPFLRPNAEIVAAPCDLASLEERALPACRLERCEAPANGCAAVVGIVSGIEPEHGPRRFAARFSEEPRIDLAVPILRPPAAGEIQHAGDLFRMPAGIDGGEEPTARLARDDNARRINIRLRPHEVDDGIEILDGGI